MEKLGNLRKFAPDFKPNEAVPSSFVFETKYPPFKKTKVMGRVEYGFEAPIGDVLSWFYREQGRSIKSVAEAIGISPGTTGEWIKKLKIQPRKKLQKSPM